MIELTVKTLDSQNHQFIVEDDITVEQFKVRIAEAVNIPAEVQRIIYCGRVLQDSSKLSDYDVHGKVVHLVQRPPPGTIPRPASRSSSPQPQRRVYRPYSGLEQGNAMYLGSMAFPGNLMESQGIVPPPPTHSLSGSRLNVARRMLRRAETVIQLLENPSVRPQEQTAAEENQEEDEVTPVIEARVIVPNNNEPIDEVLNAVQNSLLNATAGAITLDPSNAGTSGTQSNTESAQRSPNHSETSTPSGRTPRSSSTENLTTEQRPENNTSLPENASRTTEMAELLTVLGQLQSRFAPFLEHYQNFMQEDPEIAQENQRQTQTMLNRVSEVLHFLGHAYHSLSDIIIRVRTPPPRPLLCRPILIQHSAVVQTGIPIQVEAQINLSADRPPVMNNQTQNETVNTESSNTATAATTNSNTNTSNGGPTISVQSGFVGLPFLPGAAMRVQSFPLEIHTVRSPSVTPRPQNNNNNTVNTSSAPTSGNGNTEQTAANSQEGAQQQGDTFNFNNPNLEFFMEVTPEGITIDSLETTLVGSNQANDLLRGALNGPPPEFLQSLMQMAGQIINRNIVTTSAPTITSADPNQSTQQTNAQTPVGQNSQARGNTQTNPTTATTTRSTPRPHVHLAQQAMQGGFDPFLPCNSHHTSRRRLQASHVASNTGSSTANNHQASINVTASAQDLPASGQRMHHQRPNLGNFLSGLFDSLTRLGVPGAHTSGSSTSASGDSSHIPRPIPLAALFANMQGGNSPIETSRSPTLEQLLHQFQPEDQYVPGESLITDLIMLFVQNLTLVDLFTLNNGNTEPINRNINEIRNFFQVRICEGDISPTGVIRGAERLIAEMQPFLENFNSLQVRDNIDMVRSARQLCQQRLPEIINSALNLTPDTVRTLIDIFISTAKQLFALTLRASVNGQQGVEQVYEQFMNRYMQDIPQEIQNWTLMTSRIQLRQLLSNLNVPDSVIQPYIILENIPVLTSRTNIVVNNYAPQDIENSSLDSYKMPSIFSKVLAKTMELDEHENTDGELTPTTMILEDTEPLPNIALGSEPWHSQVPEDWVPIITRDAQKQRRQNHQGSFSDAYLSGMPSKRRKIVNNLKPQGSLPQVITDSVRQAVTATGLTSAAPQETIAQLAGSSPEIQTAYRNLLRSTVQANLRDNEDYLSERFPNVSSYFNSQH